MSLRERVEEIGRRAPIVRVTYTTKFKLGKAGRPEAWKDLDMTKRQVVLLRLNFFKCPIVAKRLAAAGLPEPKERFKVPAWGERVKDLPMVRHKETGEEYLWVLGEGVESSRIFAGDTEITGDPRLERLMGRPANKEFPEGTMTYQLKISNILEIEEV